jgi:hypothetical protein
MGGQTLTRLLRTTFGHSPSCQIFPIGGGIPYKAKQPYLMLLCQNLWSVYLGKITRFHRFGGLLG